MRLFLLTALLIIPTLMLAAPGVPHQLHGTVKDFTGGTLNVFIDDVNVGSTSIQSDGTFGTGSNLFFVTDANGVYAGETMTFKIGNAPATGNIVFVNGGVTEVNTELVIIGGGSTSIGSTQTTTPAPTAPSITIVAGDLNKDGVVDTQDLNLFFSLWGDESTDLNGDGVVNALDFNILMMNWS